MFEALRDIRRQERTVAVGDTILEVQVAGAGQSLQIERAVSTPREILKRSGVALAGIAIARVDGELWDLDRPVEADCKVAAVAADDPHPEVQQVVAHSAAHLLGLALEQTFPGVQLSIGPSTTTGEFFYEAHFPKASAAAAGPGHADVCDDADADAADGTTVSMDQVPRLAAVIKKAVKSKRRFERVEVTPAEAAEMFRGNPFKQSALNAALARGPDPTITVYRCGDFVDLCRGPHVQSMGLLKAVKLRPLAVGHRLDPTPLTADLARAGTGGGGGSVAMQRVFGAAFTSRQRLLEWENRQIEIAARSHRVIGANQELFMLHPSAPGAPFFLPAGVRILGTLKRFLRSHYSHMGYDEVATPLMFNTSLWQQSGHWDHYHDDMFFVSEDGYKCCDGTELNAGLKPMNCPAHCLIFKNHTRSHRDLPIRYADFSALHRNESSGALSGLTRVRQFHQDDGHIFCAEHQIFDEVKQCLDFIEAVYGAFGFEFSLNLSTRPASSIGATAVWDNAETCLRDALNSNGRAWGVDSGGGAFYGPKIDITLTDALGRHHQTATIQLDFQLPDRFDLEYDAEDGTKKRPVMIHRAVYGSLERFFAILCEHTAGSWPLWLSPHQVAVCSVAERHAGRAAEVHAQLKAAGFHVALDCSNETLGKRLRKVRRFQTNYVVVIGDAECESGSISVKCREQDKSPGTVSVDEFLALLTDESTAATIGLSSQED